MPFCPVHLENRMTVCMEYPAMTPYRASRKTPPEGGRKSMQGERQFTSCGQNVHMRCHKVQQTFIHLLWRRESMWQTITDDDLRAIARNFGVPLNEKFLN